MQLNKACELEDFSDLEFLHVAKAVFGPKETAGTDWPKGREDRKFWEVIMAVLSAQRHLDGARRSYALGIGAGIEASSFILTNFFERVVATDLYGGDWKDDAPVDMLSNPARYAGSIPFCRDRLVVERMDARDLRFNDTTFDFVYSCSSIEHFGSHEDIAKAATEMGRVLKPGGIIAVSTELCIDGVPRPLGARTLLLSEKQIHDLIIAPSGCLPVDPPNYNVSGATKSKPTSFRKALRDLRHVRSRFQDRWSQYPHIVLEFSGVKWTSVQITLRKN